MIEFPSIAVRDFVPTFTKLNADILDASHRLAAAASTAADAFRAFGAAAAAAPTAADAFRAFGAAAASIDARRREICALRAQMRLKLRRKNWRSAK